MWLRQMAQLSTTISGYMQWKILVFILTIKVCLQFAFSISTFAQCQIMIFIFMPHTVVVAWQII